MKKVSRVDTRRTSRVTRCNLQRCSMTESRDSDGDLSEALWTTNSCVQGFHVYRETWEPHNGEILECLCEPDNPEDRYAVARGAKRN